MQSNGITDCEVLYPCLSPWFHPSAVIFWTNMTVHISGWIEFFRWSLFYIWPSSTYPNTQIKSSHMTRIPFYWTSCCRLQQRNLRLRNSLDFSPCFLWPNPKILLRCTLASMHVDCWLRTYIPHVIKATCFETIAVQWTCLPKLICLSSLSIHLSIHLWILSTTMLPFVSLWVQHD